jgi:hypothetical protein
LNAKIKYEFRAKSWQYAGKGAWYFVSLPLKISTEIRKNFKWQEEGWGRLKASAKIGNTKWDTAIWFDTKSNTYLLPLKAEVRKLEHIEEEKTIKISVWL